MTEQNFWAISASDGEERDYSQIFFDFGVAFVGGENQIKTATHVKLGDYLILKKSAGKGGEGKFIAYAIGKVLSEFVDDKYFTEVDGWNLGFCCQVEWYSCSPKELPLRQGTIYKIGDEIKSRINEMVSNPKDRIKIAHKKIEIKSLHNDDITHFLVEQGFAVNHAENLIRALSRVRLLADYYSKLNRELTEDETRSFLVLPLLLALGWPEQRIRLEHNNIDIELYKVPHRCKKDAEPEVIIEIKRLPHGLENAKRQARDYANKTPSCKYFVVTNGLSYRVYNAKSDVDSKPIASMDVRQLLDTYKFDPEIKGTREVFKALFPQEYKTDIS